jgi:hypothetical protein
LQIGYFKAKQAFFSFRLADLPGEDMAFLMRRYFWPGFPPPAGPQGRVLHTAQGNPSVVRLPLLVA